jgi:hypothetical protein
MSDFAMSEAEFRALRERLRRASAWVPADRRGALNNITMSDVIAAANAVRVGRTVSLAAPIQGPAADNPDPAVHQMAHSTTASPTTPPPPPERPNSPSTSPARGSRAAACCSTSRGCAGCPGWSRAIM